MTVLSMLKTALIRSFLASVPVKTSSERVTAVAYKKLQAAMMAVKGVMAQTISAGALLVRLLRPLKVIVPSAPPR